MTSPPEPGVQPLQVNVTHSLGTTVGAGARVTQHYHLPAPAEVMWPIRVGHPPALADSYLDRPELTARINSAISHKRGGDGAVVFAADAAMPVVGGDGGTGKTQLARYAWHHHATTAPRDLVVWVTATSRADIQVIYAQAAIRIGLAAAGGEPASAAEVLLDWLASTDRTWFIVLDDVPEPAALIGVVPAASPSGGCVITTRSRDQAMFRDGRTRIDVDVFTEEEALTYLHSRLDDEDLPASAFDDAADMAADLGHLPLALAQASAVIANDNITTGQYRNLFADRKRTLDELLPPDAGYEHARSAAAAWSLATDRANQLPPVGVASRLAMLAAVMSPNGIPEPVLTATKTARTYATRTAENVSADRDGSVGAVGEYRLVEVADLRRALRNLHRFSVIRHQPNAGPRAIQMHALAQRATREHTPTEQLNQTIRAAADTLTEYWPDIDTNPSDLGLVLRANADTIRAHDSDHLLWQSGVHPVLYFPGRSLGEAGLLPAAITYFSRLIIESTQTLGPDHPDTLQTRGTLAQWRAQAGDYVGGVIALEELLTDQIRVLSLGDPAILTTRHVLAHMRGLAGDPAGAATALDDLLTDELRILGPDHRATLTTRGNLALMRGDAGDPAGAASAYQELLTDLLRVFGPDHPECGHLIWPRLDGWSARKLAPPGW